MILAAARDVFVENGSAGGRMRQIADRVGITEAYLYRHFASKDELFEAAVYEPMEQILDKLGDQVEALRAGPPPTGRELLRRANEIMLEFMVEVVPYLGVTLFSDLAVGNTLYSTRIYPRVSAPMIGLLAALDGWPPPDIPTETVVNVMWGLNYGIALDAIMRGLEVDVAKTAERVTRLYTLGLPELQP